MCINIEDWKMTLYVFFGKKKQNKNISIKKNKVFFINK